jgi:nucleoside-diphosphate-sugar epimerase
MPIPSLEKVQVLVTGGAGFIGSHLVDELLERGAIVRVLDNLETGRLENLGHCMDQVEFVEGDIRQVEVCQRVCEEVVYIFHQAALGSVPRSMEDPATTISVNVAGTANIFAAGRDADVKRIIYASSSSVYGDSLKTPMKEGEEGSLLSPYAVSKKMNEQLAEIYSQVYSLQLIGLRYFNVYGPRQNPNGPYAAVVPSFFEASAEGKNPKIYGDGKQIRDFTFIEDVVMANLLSAGAADIACGKSYNVGAGATTSVNDLAARIGEITGRNWSPKHLPARAGDARASFANVEAIKKNVGFEPSYDLTMGLSKMASV